MFFFFFSAVAGVYERRKHIIAIPFSSSRYIGIDREHSDTDQNKEKSTQRGAAKPFINWNWALHGTERCDKNAIFIQWNARSSPRKYTQTHTETNNNEIEWPEINNSHPNESNRHSECVCVRLRFNFFSNSRNFKKRKEKNMFMFSSGR